ncbi:isochorismatase family protein [Denitromonas iodatirespirans]|uniref:Isochorismatase family protein n=1 Tax=Denitromonas iodatirespirans TaxID=2795389 RepID=A0A944D5J7_DENI1|nr:isochorismatase family protein [Denitromonas iodatirespirans]MBT0960375.1 isochorismatase family protein [Denitromonas iodatirespirans]
MTPSPCVRATTSTLLVIDLQERLLPVVDQGASIIEHTLWLMRIARQLGVPTVITEQYPRGLGPTAAPILAEADGAQRVEKICFSSLAESRLADTAVTERPQVVVCGGEAHVCVLQTVLELAASGKSVFVVEEGVGSRQPRDKRLALDRMRAHGIQIVSREMVAFEWLERAGTDVFRTISRNFIR